MRIERMVSPAIRRTALFASNTGENSIVRKPVYCTLWFVFLFIVAGLGIRSVDAAYSET